MCRFLPAKLFLKDIEKEARILLHQMHQGDAAALARWHSLDPEAGTFQPRIADAQYLVAREYGFGSWQKLKTTVTREFRDAPSPIGQGLSPRLQDKSPATVPEWFVRSPASRGSLPFPHDCLTQNRALADGMRLLMATFIEKKVPGPKGPPGHKNRPAFPRVDFGSCNGQGNYDTAPCNLKMTYIEHLSGKSRCEMGQKIQNKSYRWNLTI
jgi:hypothetical protein